MSQGQPNIPDSSEKKSVADDASKFFRSEISNYLGFDRIKKKFFEIFIFL